MKFNAISISISDIFIDANHLEEFREQVLLFVNILATSIPSTNSFYIFLIARLLYQASIILPHLVRKLSAIFVPHVNLNLNYVQNKIPSSIFEKAFLSIISK